MENASIINPDLLLVGLERWKAEMKELKYFYLVTAFGLYVTTMFLCATIVRVIRTEQSLQEPMYIFISNLIFNGILWNTSILPKLMIDSVSGAVTISFHACLGQAFCLQSLCCSDIFTFTIMAFDRYLAVSSPLRYPALMTKERALQCVAVIWVISLVIETAIVTLAARLVLCGIHVNNLFCETASLVNLACHKSSASNTFGTVVTIFLVVFSQFVVIYCYLRTFIICLKISRDAYQKAIHTLVTHLIAFSIYMIGNLFIVFRHRLGSGSLSKTVQLLLPLAGVTISIVINPIIYGIRTEALRIKIFHRMQKIKCCPNHVKPNSTK